MGGQDWDVMPIKILRAAEPPWGDYGDILLHGMTAHLGRAKDGLLFTLEPRQFVLSQTLETVEFPIKEGSVPLAARVEGRSSWARCGLLVHFTAPTIHAGFKGPIILEICNLGPATISLRPG